jgi:hypothetical protein
LAVYCGKLCHFVSHCIFIWAMKNTDLGEEETFEDLEEGSQVAYKL